MNSFKNSSVIYPEVFLNNPFVLYLSQWDNHPYSVLLRKTKKKISKSSLRLFLLWRTLGDHKQEFIITKATVPGTFLKKILVSYLLYKVILTCLHNWLWQFSDMISNKNKKKNCSRFFKESLPLGSWFWPSAKIMCKGASLGIHGSLQH